MNVMHSYSEHEVNLDVIRRKKVAILGYGSQGRAQALNLRDTLFPSPAGGGVGWGQSVPPNAPHLTSPLRGEESPNICIGLPAGSKSIARAQADGFTVASPPEAAAWADVIVILAPDEKQPALYEEIAPHLKPGAALAFAHGFAVHFGYITPREDLDVIMIAPKEAGPVVRTLYEAGKGAPCLIAVHQDRSGHAKALALSYAAAIGGARAGIYETTFKDECEVDLFGEQAVLFGGVPALMRAAFETLVDAGYDPQMAYFKCVQQVKLVVDLIAARGMADMLKAVSNTAEYGGYVAAPKIVTHETRAAMQRLLAEIQSGAFAKAWMEENRNGGRWLEAQRHAVSASRLETAGKCLREPPKGD